MDQFGGHQDSSFWSRIFRVREPERRFREPRQLIQPPDPVQFGDFALFTGYRQVGDDGHNLQLVWQAIQLAQGQQHTDQAYNIDVHVLDSNGQSIMTWNAAPDQGEFTAYATTLWEPGEYIIELHRLDLPAGDYTLRIAMINPVDQQPVPVTVNGVNTDSYAVPVTLP
jgi:hypothetical protein